MFLPPPVNSGGAVVVDPDEIDIGDDAPPPGARVVDPDEIDIEDDDAPSPVAQDQQISAIGGSGMQARAAAPMLAACLGSADVLPASIVQQPTAAGAADPNEIDLNDV